MGDEGDRRRGHAVAREDLPDAGEDALRRVGRHGGELESGQAPGVLVPQGDVGERSADVDAEPRRHRAGTGPIFSQYWRIRRLPGGDSNAVGRGPPGGPQQARLCLASMIS